MSDAATLIIGASSGIGEEIANLYKERFPERELFTPSRDELDVTAYPGMMCEDLADVIGLSRIDRLVYSAGFNQLSEVGFIRHMEYHHMMQVNVIGFVLLLGILRNLGHPLQSVVAVSSDAAIRPMRTSTMYCSSKAALDSAVKCMARELAPEVRVNAVSPGMTADTEMTRYIDAAVPAIRGWTEEEALAYENSQIPMGRRANKSEISETVLWVLEGPEYLTGAIIPVNGGR